MKLRKSLLPVKPSNIDPYYYLYNTYLGVTNCKHSILVLYAASRAGEMVIEIKYNALKTIKEKNNPSPGRTEEPYHST